jgi:hypothetical protein
MCTWLSSAVSNRGRTRRSSSPCSTTCPSSCSRAFYLDDDGGRFLNVEWESEPEASTQVCASTTLAASTAGIPDFREFTLTEVAEAVAAPVELVWNRPRKGARYEATLLSRGRIRLTDGREFPRHRPALRWPRASVVSYDVWYAWRIGGDTGRTPNYMRHQLADQGSSAPQRVTSGKRALAVPSACRNTRAGFARTEPSSPERSRRGGSAIRAFRPTTGTP